MKRWMRFKVLIWVVAIVVVVWCVGGPLLNNEIARRTWKETPCKIGTISYRFMVNGQLYWATRRNFWDVNYHHGTYPFAPLETDTTCWINPADPEDAVLRLDTLTNWSLAWDQLRPPVLALGGAFLLTIFGLKKPKAAAGASRPSNQSGGKGP